MFQKSGKSLRFFLAIIGIIELSKDYLRRLEFLVRIKEEFR